MGKKRDLTKSVQTDIFDNLERYSMQKKVTWEMIFKDFKSRHPNLQKEVTYWRPRDYLTIELWMDDGSTMSYDYRTHRAEFATRKPI